MTLQAS